MNHEESSTRKRSRWVDWIGGHELAILVGLAITSAAVWAFVELAGAVDAGGTQSMDDRLIRALRRADDPATPIGPAWLPEIGRDLTALGGIAVLVLVTAAVTGFLVLAGKPAAAWLVVVATLGGLALSTALKHWFDRPRPELVPHLSHVATSSFPSGHSMMAAVVYLTLGSLLGRFVEHRRLKFFFLAVAVGVTILVGCSRVYMGVHYPTDVLAGWTAGLAWASICWVVTQTLQRRGAVEVSLEESAD